MRNGFCITAKDCMRLREMFAHLRCTNNLAQIDVHPSVATDQMTVVCLAIFQLNQLWTKQTKQIMHFFYSEIAYASVGKVFAVFVRLTYHWMALGGFQQ